MTEEGREKTPEKKTEAAFDSLRHPILVIVAIAVGVAVPYFLLSQDEPGVELEEIEVTDPPETPPERTAQRNPPHPALLDLDNVVLTPHLGGAATESRQKARALCAENVLLALEGKTPRTPVNQF